MNTRYRELRGRADAHGQGHVFRWWDQLDDAQRARLLDQVAEVDFALLDELTRTHLQGQPPEIPFDDLEPMEPIPLPATPEDQAVRRRAAAQAEEALRAGQVAALVAAGGLGTRLGYDGPKGTFPASPISGKSLFQLHAEKILAARRRCQAAIPWYVMTSEATDGPTRAFFEDHGYFGLPTDDVVFVQQGKLPVVDREGRMLLEAKDRLALSPNGHGGTLYALRDGGALDDLARRDIRVLSYFQVDNVLVKAIDPVFLGFHIERGSEFSCKALAKRHADEGLGAFCYAHGKPRVIEYSDLPDVHKYAARPDGRLRFEAGSIAIHAISVGFCQRLLEAGFALPYHRADKTVSHIDENGRAVEPNEPNAVKFEMFLFDVLPEARDPLVLMVERAEEFAPIKQADLEDTPTTARQAQCEHFARWLERAGVAVRRDHAGRVVGAIEISPLVADSLEEFLQRGPDDLHFDGGLSLQP